MNTNTNPTPAAEWHDLPIRRLSRDEFDALPVAENPAIGDTVAIYSRGAHRVGRVAKVGPKRVTVAYTTQGALDTAQDIAAGSREANLKSRIADAHRIIARYEAIVEVMERLNITPTDDLPLAEKFVPMAGLPAEYRALDEYARGTTIVYSAAQYATWIASTHESIAKWTGELPAAREYDALPFADKVREHTHVTTKAVARENVRAA